MVEKRLHPGDAIKTYRYLRIGIVCTVLLLGVAIANEVLSVELKCMQTSISAYYYTPVRGIFVGALMAIGLALIVIKGRPVEDIALNVAGMFAPVVAIIPTSGIGTCWSIEPEPAPLIGPKDGKELAGWVVANIENNFYALAFVGLAGLAFACYLAVRDRRAGTSAAQLDKNMRVSAAITGLILVVSLFLMATWDGFKEVAHYAAAILMFVALNIAVIAKARERKESSRKYFRWYSSLAWLMSLIGLAVWGLAAAVGIDQHVLIIEVWEIAMFAAFWSVQTIDNWREEVASAPSAAAG